MKERIFIQKAKENVNMEEFIRKQFADVKCSNIEVQYTPIVTRIIIYTVTPGLVIGSGGERIRETVEKLKEAFKIDNPQIDVQKIERADLDPDIVAKSIASSIENGVNYKRLGNFYVEKIMKAGAIGCEIIMSGKLSGERSRRERFTEGYLKKCGETAERNVIKGFAVANPKLGNIGITVKIMMKMQNPILLDEYKEKQLAAKEEQPEPKKPKSKKKKEKEEAEAAETQQEETKEEAKPEEAASTDDASPKE